MDDYGLDMNEVTRVIDSADVLVVRFAILDKRLLIDARTNDKGDGPLIAVVPKAESVEERFKELKKLRPRFPLPEKIMSFTWPRHIDTFKCSGLPERIESRLVSLGGEEMAASVRKAIADLASEEKAEVLSAIRGDERYQTIWQRAE
ncbi:MAG TPA: hypothetical protein VMT90_06295 [Dehalococcoidia bacterium]|jgi:hypothetical protein|nr:hypothetical protein [Dehalococcoidia bacterium]